MGIQLTIRLEAAEIIRMYSGGGLNYIPGDILGSIHYLPKIKGWYWRSSYQSRYAEGFADLEEALAHFAKHSHPEPLHIAGVYPG